MINKYFPPNFDPSMVPKGRKSGSRQAKVRMMLPFSVRCLTCSEYIWKAKKFNARKEEVKGEDYLGIKVWRFYIKCPLCSSEITFKTDPEHGSYACEHGAQLAHKRLLDENIKEKEEVKEDAISRLEARQEESKREMQQLEELTELHERSEQNAEVDALKLLRQKQKEHENEAIKLQEEDERLIQSIFKRRQTEKSESSIPLRKEMVSLFSKQERRVPKTVVKVTKKPKLSVVPVHNSSSE